MDSDKYTRGDLVFTFIMGIVTGIMLVCILDFYGFFPL